NTHPSITDRITGALVIVSRSPQPCTMHLDSSCPASFNATATAQTYTLSLHDALPIYVSTRQTPSARLVVDDVLILLALVAVATRDRKSTRLNSSHVKISYAVFCLKKKKVHTS